ELAEVDKQNSDTDCALGNSFISPAEATSKPNRNDKSLEKHMKSFENRLQVLSKEFAANMSTVNNILLEHSNELKQINNPHPDSELTALKRENLELKNQNKDLTDRIRKRKPIVPAEINEVNKNLNGHRQKENQSENKPNITIVGDSMIKNINPRKLSRKRVNKFTFPGKRAEEIAFEIKNINVQLHPTHVIIHAGTNNLPTDTGDQCIKNIKGLCSSIKEKFPKAKLGVSSIILWKDIEVSSKMYQVNEDLKRLCNESGFSFIDNSIIDESGLNNSKLHLSAKASVLLATRFIKFLNPDKQLNEQPKVNSDLNCDWNKTPLDSHTQRLKNICVLYQLSQIIDEPTRVTKSSATQIDLILANNPESISNHGVIEIGISDHSLIYAVKKLVPLKGQRTCSEVRNFKNFNERLFLHDLSRIPWDYVNQFNNPNDSWQVWKSFFIEVLDRHAPILRKYIKTKRIPWLNASIKQLMRQRDFHKMMFKKINSEMHWEKFKTIRNKINAEILKLTISILKYLSVFSIRT
ncbi:RNA-directed DNA polymerase from transposon BS, partial [Paramuricea clavata]